MDSISELGSRFKARVLMQVTVKDCDSPSYGIFPMTSSEYLNSPELQPFEVWADISYVCNIMSDPKEHRVCINWGGRTAETTPKVLNRGVLLYFERLKFTEEFSIHGIKELPDIVVSVFSLDKKKHISYVRIPITEAIDVTKKSKLYFLEPDRAIDPNLRDDLAGCIKMRVGVCTSKGWANSAAQYGWDQVPSMTSAAFKKVYIFSNIFQAKALAAGDDDGLSDPMVNLNHFGTNLNTVIFPRTLNPTWNERILMASWSVNGELPPMLVKIFDHDPASGLSNVNYDYLGGCAISFGPEHMTTDINFVPAPTWLEVRQDKNHCMGKLLASFTVLDGNTPLPQQIPRTLSVAKSKHYVKIKILGLRNLQSLGSSQIRRPFIRINMNSLKSIDQANAEVKISDIVTEPKEPGANPNIGTVLS